MSANVLPLPSRMPPLVVLPGLLCDSRMFSAQIADFDAQVIDGFYGGANRIEGMADYVLARLPGRCALLGHSMGARVAFEIWRRAPQKVARLAIADTGIHGVTGAEIRKRHALRDLGRSSGAEALVDAWLPPMIGDSNRNDESLWAALRAMCVSAGTRIFEAQIEALLNRPDAAPVLETITCPMFAIVGQEDLWSPIDQHRAIAARVSGAQLRIIEGAGHMAPAERPAAFNKVIGEWLAWPAPETDNQHTKLEGGCQ